MQYLALVGVSGAGKTYLRDELCRRYPEIFYKVDQATTRPMRDTETENDYLFISDKEYDEMKDNLIGRTEINGYRYGSIVDPEKAQSRIGVIVLNELGLENFKKVVDVTQYVSIGINRKIEDLEVKREGRDEEYLKKEREVLNKCNYVVNLEKGLYTNMHVVKNICLTHFNTYFDRIEVMASEYQSVTTMYKGGMIYSINDIVTKPATKDEGFKLITHMSEEVIENSLDPTPRELLLNASANGVEFINHSSENRKLN